MMLAFLLAQATMNVPVQAGVQQSPISDPSSLSLVIADTVSETDPQPLCKRGHCNSLFLGEYRNASVVAGRPIPTTFKARIEMGSPWNMSYRLALLVEHREGREALVRGTAGFNERTHRACFFDLDAKSLGWMPSDPRVEVDHGTICVKE